MQIVALILTLALLTLVAAFLYAPFLRSYSRRVTQEERELSALMAERDRTINALQELDFDFKLGKIPEEDYPIQRSGLLKKGADILRQMDTLTLPSNGRGSGGNGQETEERIEQAIAARRADASGAKPEITDDRIESMVSLRRQGRKSKSSGFCPRCGKPVMVTDRFCPSCGRALV